MKLRPYNKVVLRTPSETLNNAYQGLTNGSLYKEGVYLSSKEFWREAEKTTQIIRSEDEKVTLSLTKYHIRNCTRCTPYATFAGSTLLDVSDEATKICVANPQLHKRKIRIDTNYLNSLIIDLIAKPVIQDQILFYPNNSIYNFAGGYRYAEYMLDNGTRTYHLSSVQSSNYLTQILDKAAHGVTINELTQMLSQTEDVNLEEAKEFINELMASQLLVSELEPNVTGKEPLDTLIARLEQLEAVGDVLSELKYAQYLIQNYQPGIAHLQSIEEILHKLPLAVEPPKNTLQVDLFLSMKERNINKAVIDAITTQAEDLMLLARPVRNPELEGFINKFRALYEDAEVPLSIALDSDLGIGYAGVKDESSGGSDLIDDLAITGRSASNRTSRHYIEQYAADKYFDYLRHQKPVIEITTEEIQGFKKHTEGVNFPSSMFLMGSLLANGGTLDKDNFSFAVTSFGGPSAGSLLGRFTHGDEEICALTKELLQDEGQEFSDAIVAEVVHLPQARVGNILLRPVLREYEIPYLGKSGAPLEKQILIEDLMVSVRNGEVYLRSKKHNKRIIPRLTTAHNFSYQSLPVYKFLCDLQMQNYAHANVWDWGAMATEKHLPRVIYKNLVLQKAFWKVDEKDISNLPKSMEDFPSYFKAFREKINLPERVMYIEGDNGLLIDFSKETGVDLFIHYIRRRKNITLEEFLFTPDNCIIADGAGSPFTNELIIPLHNETVAQKEAALNSESTNSVQRNFPPGSEWSYFKIYCGAKTAEKLLCELIHPFVESGIKDGLFEKFFFIRYRDEEGGHFRIRFYNSQQEKHYGLQAAFMRILKPVLDSSIIQKVQIDTYKRELERYGSDMIEASETLFNNDSFAVLSFIQILDAIDGQKYRLLFSLRGIEALLSDFGYSLSKKQELMKRLQAGFFKEFGASPALQKQLNDKYRKYQGIVFSHLDPDNDASNEIENIASILATRSEMNGAVIRQLDEVSIINKSSSDDLVSSHIHMFINRLFIAQQRKYELLLYHFLDKYYSSMIAIQKGKSTLRDTKAEHKL